MVWNVAYDMRVYWDAVEHFRRQLAQPFVDQGYRIVTGGQTNGNSCEITDVDFREVLATGTTNIDEFDETLTRRVHHDNGPAGHN